MSTLAPSSSKISLTYLDGLRGLAASYVMIGHCRWLLWEGYQWGYLFHPDTYSLFDKGLMYFLTIFKYGHQAVMVFFVLSGFVIHLRYSKMIAEQGANAKFDFWPFFKRRLKRIYPAFLLSIVIAYVLYKVGMYLVLPSYNFTMPQVMVNHYITGEYGWDTLWPNLLFLQNLTNDFHEWSNNGPLWSLALEWWFYVCYPVLFYCTRRSLLGTLVGVLGIYCISQYLSYNNYQFLFLPVGKYLIIWWMGALLADVYTGRLKIPYWLVALPVVMLPLAIEDIHVINNLVVLLPLVGLSFAGLIGCGLYWQSLGHQLPVANWLRWLGQISYSLYIVHLPILAFMTGAIVKYVEGGVRMPVHFGWILPGIAVCLLSGYLVYLIAEKPFLAKSRR